MNKNKNRKTRTPPQREKGESSMTSFLVSETGYEMLCGGEYTRLSDCPEIRAAVQRVSDIVSSMTIYLMENSDGGDRRITNQLSRIFDISPNPYMTKKTFITNIIQSLMLDGNGNAVVYPVTSGGWLTALQPIPPAHVGFMQNTQGFGYVININGKSYDPADICHFVINPDSEYPWKGTGYKRPLKDITKNLKQAAKTKNAFMSDKWKPSIIVKVDAENEELSDPKARDKLTNKYLSSIEAGKPWMIPADNFEVINVKPLTLNELAINEAVNVDKKTAAALVGVPEWLVGVGTFSEKEWNNFISTKIKGICDIITQEMTRKLLINPAWYLKFNMRSVYSYDITTLSNVGANLYTRGIMDGNEVRGWLDLTPRKGLEELVILENYIPQGMIGEQKKLIQEGGEGDGTESF